MVLLHEQRTSLLDSECQDVVYIAPMTNEEGFRMSRAVCTYGGGILSYTQCPRRYGERRLEPHSRNKGPLWGIVG